MPFLEDYPYFKVLRQLSRKRKIELYLVGGFIRDFLLKRECCDFDFAIEKNALGFAKKFAKDIRGAYVLLDQDHGCARVVKKIEGQPWTFDFADYRGKTLEEDLLHRDFTINVFHVPIHVANSDDEIQDIIRDFRSGKRDFNKKSIRMITPRVFKEDPLRVLRAFSLKAQCGFSIEPKTAFQIKKDRVLVPQVSYERIRDELFKVLEAPCSGKIFKEMDRYKLIGQIMPQVEIMFNVEQGTYHHLDVWRHSLETVSQLDKLLLSYKADNDWQEYLGETLGGKRTRRAILKLAALLHDIGKPESRVRTGVRMQFHGHERLGKTIVRHIAKLLKLSTKERFILEDLVFWHLRPGYLSNFKKPTERAIFRYFRNTKDEAASIAILAWADQRSTRGPMTTQADLMHHEKICESLIKRFFAKKKEKPFTRLINGKDLIKYLKLKPAPVFKEILDRVEEQQVLGIIKTKEDALSLARQLILKRKKNKS